MHESLSFLKESSAIKKSTTFYKATFITVYPFVMTEFPFDFFVYPLTSPSDTVSHPPEIYSYFTYFWMIGTN